MGISIDKKNESVYMTFLKDTKDGKYVKIESRNVEIPRVMTSRNEFVYDETLPLYYTICSHI